MSEVIVDLLVPVHTAYVCDKCKSDEVRYIEKRSGGEYHECKSCSEGHFLSMPYPATKWIPEQQYIQHLAKMDDAAKSPILTMNG